MKIESMKIVEGKVLLMGGGQEWYLPDGVYRRDDGTAITVSGHKVTDALVRPDLEHASLEEWRAYVSDLEQQLSTVGSDAQLATIDLQNSLQKQQQTLQTMSNMAKNLHDTARAVIRKVG